MIKCVTRAEDMSPDGRLRIWQQEDGDVTEGNVNLSIPGSDEDIEPDLTSPEGDITGTNFDDLLGGGADLGAAPAGGAAPAAAPAAAPMAAPMAGAGAPPPAGLAAGAKGQMKKRAF